MRTVIKINREKKTLSDSLKNIGEVGAWRRRGEVGIFLDKD
jgi:hypothetical protein